MEWLLAERVPGRKRGLGVEIAVDHPEKGKWGQFGRVCGGPCGQGEIGKGQLEQGDRVCLGK
jgi:hypothetical protein